MKFTSEERSKIATRMRDAVCSGEYLDDSIIRAIYEAIGETKLPVGFIIADLVDPTCHMDAISTGEQADYECSEHIMHCSNCSAEFGYVLYSEDRGVSMDDKPRFCPHCGARVVSYDD